MQEKVHPDQAKADAEVRESEAYKFLASSTTGDEMVAVDVILEAEERFGAEESLKALFLLRADRRGKSL